MENVTAADLSRMTEEELNALPFGAAYCVAHDHADARALRTLDLAAQFPQCDVSGNGRHRIWTCSPRKR